MDRVAIMVADVASTSGRRLKLKQDGINGDEWSEIEYRAADFSQYYVI